MGTWLDLQFSRGDAVIGRYYWYRVPTPTWYPNAVYPEVVGGSFSAINTYITGGWLLPTDPNIASAHGEADIAITGHDIPWSTAWDAHEPECWSVNGPRDPLFAEVSLRFDHAWVDAFRAKYPWIDVDQDILECENNYSDGWVLSLSLDEDANGNPSPGFHTLWLWAWYDWGDGVNQAIYTFTEAQLFDGQTHTFRAEWRMSTVACPFATYRSRFASLFEEDLVADGEFEVFWDSASIWSSNTLKYAINGAAGWVSDAYYGNNGWEVEGEAAYTRGWNQLGQYNQIWLSPGAAAYGYLRVGAVPGWLDIANFNEVLLDSTLFNGRIPSVQMELWTSDPAATIQARLYDGDAEASVGESIVVTGTTATKVEFDVTLNTGTHPYRLQVTSNMGGVELFCAGPGLVERPSEEVTPPAPDPPPVSDRPSWWKDYDATIPAPRTSGTFHLMGAGSFTQYRWTGVSAIIDDREGPMAFAGDLHGDVDINTAARIEFVAVAGATAYRVYVFNCTSEGELFDAHLHNTNLVVATGTGPVLVQFKDVVPPPNWGGWPPEEGFYEEDIPDYECDFLGDSDGTAWTMWP